LRMAQWSHCGCAAGNEKCCCIARFLILAGQGSVGNNIILQYIALLGAYYTSAILRIVILYWLIYRNIAIAIEQYIAI
jgi:hypothetical protein